MWEISVTLKYTLFCMAFWGIPQLCDFLLRPFQRLCQRIFLLYGWCFYYFPGLKKDVVDYLRLHTGTAVLHVPSAWHTAVLGPNKVYLCRVATWFVCSCLDCTEKMIKSGKIHLNQILNGQQKVCGYTTNIYCVVTNGLAPISYCYRPH